jgi:hypothetical protein
MIVAKVLSSLLSALAAGAAAYYWFRSASVPLPQMTTYWGHAPETDPFFEALKRSAELSQEAACYAGISATAFVIASVIETVETLRSRPSKPDPGAHDGASITGDRVPPMDFEWLPQEITSFCAQMVKSHHKSHGGSPPKILWHRDTTVFIGVHHDLLTILGAANTAWKISIASAVAALLAFAFGILLNWWIAIAAILGVIVMIYFKKRMQDLYTLLAAIILATELLADNVAGCMEEYPAAVLKARGILDEYVPNDRTRLLDLYLPGRADLPHGAFAALVSAPK